MDHIKKVLKQKYRIDIVNGKKIKSGSFNDVWQVYNNDFCYIVKKINHQYALGWLKWFRKIMDKLEDNSISNNFIKNTNDEIITIFKDGLWSVHKYIEGEHFIFGNVKHLNEVGRFLIKMQTIVCKDNDQISLGTEDYFQRMAISPWYENAQKTFETFNKSIIEKYYKTKNANKSIKNIMNILPHLDFDKYQRLPITLSHGELQGTNLIFQGQKLLCVIDWDSINIRPRLFDIAISACFLCRKKRGGFKLNLVILKNYIRKFKLSRSEVENLTHFIYLYFLPKSYYILRYLKYAPEKLNWYLEWSLNAFDELYAQLSKESILHEKLLVSDY